MTFIHLFKNGHLFFVIALFSRIFLWKVQAPTIRNSRPEVLRRVLSRTPLFSFRSLLSRTRRNLLINKTKVHFSPSLFVFLFTARSFLSRSKLSPRLSLSLLGRRPLRPLWLPSRPPPRFLLLRRPLEEFQLWSCVSGTCLLHMPLFATASSRSSSNVILGRWPSFCVLRDLI